MSDPVASGNGQQAETGISASDSKSGGGSQAPAIQAIPHVIHGVECYEAWRDDTDCRHEKEAVDA